MCAFYEERRPNIGHLGTITDCVPLSELGWSYVLDENESTDTKCSHKPNDPRVVFRSGPDDDCGVVLRLSKFVPDLCLPRLGNFITGAVDDIKALLFDKELRLAALTMYLKDRDIAVIDEYGEAFTLDVGFAESTLEQHWKLFLRKGKLGLKSIVLNCCLHYC